MPADSNGRVDGLVELLIAEQTRLRRLLHERGALLFRGFGVRRAAELERVVTAAGGEPMVYRGGDSPRTRVSGAVYTSTELPASLPIPLHNEMSYLARHPRELWFAGVSPARAGGATTVADGRAVLRRLDGAVRARFERLGIRYRWVFRGDRSWLALLDRVQKVSKSWMEAFDTDQPEAAVTMSRAIADHHEWLPSGHLALESLRPATIRHPDTGELAWFNQAHLFRLSPRLLGWWHFVLSLAVFPRHQTRSHHASFGDGSALDREILEHVCDVLDGETRAIDWQAGDVLWIDNLTCMHGRRPFRGARRLLVEMTS